MDLHDFWRMEIMGLINLLMIAVPGGNVARREIRDCLRSIRKRYTNFMRGLTWCVQRG